MTDQELAVLMVALRERLAAECDNEKAAAEYRLDRGVAANVSTHAAERIRAEQEGQRKAAYWCAKHVREVDVAAWLQGFRK